MNGNVKIDKDCLCYPPPPPHNSHLPFMFINIKFINVVFLSKCLGIPQVFRNLGLESSISTSLYSNITKITKHLKINTLCIHHD